MAAPNLHSRLDAARGLSAIIVLIDHAFGIIVGRISGRDTTWYALSVLGDYAVVVFFLLSGHLITRSLLSNLKRNGGRLDVKEYVASRISRIYPPLIGSVVLCVILWCIMSASGMAGIQRPLGYPDDPVLVRTYVTLTSNDILSALTLQQGGLLQINGALWSLYIECQMYLVVCATFLIWKGSRFAAVCAVLLAVPFCNALWAQPVMVGVWVIGAATTLIQERKLWACVAAAAVGVLCVLAFRQGNLHDVLKGLMLGPDVIAIAFICSYILFFFRETARFPSFLTSTAGYSYSLYIVHFPVLLFILSATQEWVVHSLPRAWLIFVISIVLIPAIAHTFARVAERQAFFKSWLLSGRSTIVNGKGHPKGVPGNA